MTENPLTSAPPVPGVGTYTSRPVTITAVRWDGTAEHAEQLVLWIESVSGLKGGACYIPGQGPLVTMYTKDGGFDRITIDRPGHIVIGTLEGHMKLEAGAWLIKGTEDEFYPCKDSVFQAKYRGTATEADSTIQLSRHEYAENSFILDHFTGALLLSREDLIEAHRQMDAFLYPNPGYAPKIAEVPRG